MHWISSRAYIFLVYVYVAIISVVTLLDYGGAHGIIVSILVGLHQLHHHALGYCDFLDYHLRKSWWGDEFYNEASSSVV